MNHPMKTIWHQPLNEPWYRVDRLKLILKRLKEYAIEVKTVPSPIFTNHVAILVPIHRSRQATNIISNHFSRKW
jgi:hypothetical protein